MKKQNPTNKKIPVQDSKNSLQDSIKKRNKLTALAGLGGILLGFGSAIALAPLETKEYLANKIENAIYVAGARELETNLPCFAIPFTRYNHVDTSEQVKSDLLEAREKLRKYAGNFIYQTAQNQNRAISGKTLEDLTLRDYFHNEGIKEEILEEPVSWDIHEPELIEVNKLAKPQDNSNLVKKIEKNYKDYIVSPEFVSYIIHIESSGRPNAVGSSGERGLMQLMWHTWHDATKRIYGTPISFDKAFKPEENIRAGVAQLEWLEEVYLPKNVPGWHAYSEKMKRDSILAAYNIGPSGFIKNYQGNPYHIKLPETTKNYILKMDNLVYGKKQVADAVSQWAGLIRDVFEE